MVKQLLLILPILLTVACARPANKEAQLISASVGNPVQSTNVLWQHHGGNLGATNVVNGRLPKDGSIQIGATESSFNIYCAPLVVEIDGNQHVYALWANTNTLKVVKYIYSSGKLTPDSEFSSITLTSSNNHKAHQMAVTIKDNKPILFVAHGGGIARYNGLTGETLHTYTAANNVYRLTITNKNVLIAQSADRLLKLNANTLDPSGTNPTFTYSSYHPTNQLPLVISGNSVFFEHNNEVKKLVIDTFDNMMRDGANEGFDFEDSMDSGNNGNGLLSLEINHLKTDDATISAISAINFNNTDTVVYATVSHFKYQKKDPTGGLVNTANDTGLFIFGQSQDDTFNFNRERHSMEPKGAYSRYCRQFETYSGKNTPNFTSSFSVTHSNADLDYTNGQAIQPEYISACAFGAGDSTFTPLAVNGTELFLPGVYWNNYKCNESNYHCDKAADTNSEKHRLTGIQRVPSNKGAIASAFLQDTHEVKGGYAPGPDITNALDQAKVNVDFFYTNRFVIFDTSLGYTFTIANISNYFFDNPKSSRSNGSFVSHLETQSYPTELKACDGETNNFGDCSGTETIIAEANTLMYKDIITADIDKLKNYNSKIVVGTSGITYFDAPISNTNTSINTVSVGRGVVFIADDQNNLHYFH